VVLGRLVVAILRQVALLARPFDRLGYLDAAARRQVFVLGFQALIGGARERVSL
jgi:hypothetical protein